MVPESLFNELRPAIASGRSIFAVRTSGNGKTALARCIGEVFGDPVYIPYAMYVQGQIMRVYDEFVPSTGGAGPGGSEIGIAVGCVPAAPELSRGAR